MVYSQFHRSTDDDVRRRRDDTIRFSVADYQPHDIRDERWHERIRVVHPSMRQSPVPSVDLMDKS